MTDTSQNIGTKQSDANIEGSSGSAQLICKICNKMFQSELSFKIHEAYHDERKPHPCCICGKRFEVLFRLQKHMYSHPRESPVTCPVCCKTYAKRLYIVGADAYLWKKVHHCTSCATLSRKRG
ncbi:unnamed protein product [Clavelina lepadiformis]|uniref:C2H2-type domain-containing protein n=1 Tax=Clavelina lepadiformis TaxID=159417 RepID=A0ABP0GDK1_CLALP